jgi:hypothetical protein
MANANKADDRTKQGAPTQPLATLVPATENSDTATIQIGLTEVNGRDPSRCAPARAQGAVAGLAFYSPPDLKGTFAA